MNPNQKSAASSVSGHRAPVARYAGPALRASDIPYYELFLNAPLGMARVSREGRFLEVNPEFCAMLGHTRQELCGAGLMQITHPADVAASLDRLRQINDGAISSFAADTRFVRRDGGIRWLRLCAATVRDGGERPGCHVFTFEDISEHRRSAQMLEEREKYYRSVLDTTANGFWTADLDGRLREVNDAYCRISGYSREELLGMRASDLVDDETADKTAVRIARIRECGGINYTTHHLRKDGTRIPLAACATYNPALGERIFAFFHDINDSHVATAQRQDTHDDLQALIENMPDSVIIKDPVARWRLINRSAARLLDLKGKIWLGRSDRQLAESHAGYRNLHRAIGRNEGAIWCSRIAHVDYCRVQAENKREILLELRKSPIFDDAGKPRAMLVVVRDITGLGVATQVTPQRAGGGVGRRPGGPSASAARGGPGRPLNQSATARPANGARSRKAGVTSGAISRAQSRAAVLPDMLRDVARELERGVFGLVVHFSERGRPYPVDDDRSRRICEIVQRITRNAVTDGHATVLWINVDFKSPRLAITVTDNVAGTVHRDPKRRGKRDRLQGVRRQVALMGASLSVDALDRGGARVLVGFPRDGGQVS